MDCEVLDVLKYVRPGNGYEPKFPMFSKMDVNGTGESEIFTFLKAALPYPSGEYLSRSPSAFLYPIVELVSVVESARRDCQPL